MLVPFLKVKFEMIAVFKIWRNGEHLFHCFALFSSQIVLYFLHNTLVLSFYIDVLTLLIYMAVFSIFVVQYLWHLNARKFLVVNAFQQIVKKWHKTQKINFREAQKSVFDYQVFMW